MDKRYFKWRYALAVILTTSLLACGGKNDPILKELNSHLDIDITGFKVNHSDLVPGQILRIEWRANGAFFFKVKLYLSQDQRISTDDIIVTDKECGLGSNDHCYAAREVIFLCDYNSDNDFSCFHDGDFIGGADLTHYFTELPLKNYLILELCRGSHCEYRTHRFTFW